MAGNMIIGYENFADDATLTAGSESASMPVENLQDVVVANQYRSADVNTANTYIDVDLGTEKEVSLIGFFNHETYRLATYRVYASTGAGATGTKLFDSRDNNPNDLDFWERAYDSLSLKWESPEFWFGQVSDEEAESYYLNAVYVPETTIFSRYFRIYIDDSSNPLGYFDIGRLYMGSSIQLPQNFVYGSSEGTLDPTPRSETLSGVVVKDRRPRRRKATYVINEIPETDINYRPIFKSLLNRVGLAKQIVVVPNPDNVLEKHFNAMLCSQSRLNDVTYASVNVSATRLDLEEEK